MCTELGNDENMQAYVESAGATSLCSVETLQGCSDKEKGFIGNWKGKKSQADVAKQIKRLTGMSGESMKPELMKWIKQRLAVLKQLSTEPKAEL